jgi:hypothetical protein
MVTARSRRDPRCSDATACNRFRTASKSASVPSGPARCPPSSRHRCAAATLARPAGAPRARPRARARTAREPGLACLQPREPAERPARSERVGPVRIDPGSQEPDDTGLDLDLRSERPGRRPPARTPRDAVEQLARPHRDVVAAGRSVLSQQRRRGEGGDEPRPVSSVPCRSSSTVRPRAGVGVPPEERTGTSSSTSTSSPRLGASDRAFGSGPLTRLRRAASRGRPRAGRATGRGRAARASRTAAARRCAR